MKDIFDCLILIVDDEIALCKMIKDILYKDGFMRVTTANDCCRARQLFLSQPPECLILDVMLQDGDGFDLMREFRSSSSAPVLFLSARDEDDNRLLGLGLGADDYISKPFLPRELMLRLKAILSRTYFPISIKQTIKPCFWLGDTEVDLNSGCVRSVQGEESLTAKEYTLLETLYENRGRIVTGDTLCRVVWGDNLYGLENTLMVHIRRLREKIEPEPSQPKYLLTMRGLGYKLILE